MTHPQDTTPANPAQGVSGQDVRTVCEWLASHIGNISLMDWNPCVNVLLQAADRLDAIDARRSVERVAKEIAFAGRTEHDMSVDPDDFWEHTVEDSRARYRAMALAAIGAGGQAVAWRISCPDDEIYGRGPDTLRFHPLSSDEIAFGYTQQPLFSNPPAQPGWRDELLDRLAEHKNFELSWGAHPDDETEACWQVHRVNGGRNDREWTLIGIGNTPHEALYAALPAAPQPTSEGE